ncbi:MAG TPA: restriction endonuclease subunit S [bacterium]|nr:restriction endonuclease subunit S [bacterium]
MSRVTPSSATDDLPEGWAEATIGDVTAINPPKPTAHLLPHKAPITFVPMPAVDAHAGAIVGATDRAFGEVRSGYTAFRDGDVLFAKITPCMENGKAAIARGLKNGLGFGSSEFHVLRPSAAALAEYLFYYIRQESYRREAEEHMTGSVGQKRVPADYVENTEMPLPPFAEQRRIVAKVEELLAQVNQVRERLARVPAILKRFRSSVLTQACGDTAAEKWPVVEFGSVIEELKNGTSEVPQFVDTDKPILRISAVRSRSVRLDDVRHLQATCGELDDYLIDDGDLLFTRYNGSLDLLGVCGMVRNLGRSRVYYPDKLMRVRVDGSRLVPEYAELFFASPQARDRITAKAKSSAGQQGVSGANIKAQPILLPPVSEQRSIVRRVEKLFKLADDIEKQVEAATKRVDKLTLAILAKAFRGELVPTEAELARKESRSYEPASVLLERIRHERAKAESIVPG